MDSAHPSANQLEIPRTNSVRHRTGRRTTAGEGSRASRLGALRSVAGGEGRYQEGRLLRERRRSQGQVREAKGGIGHQKLDAEMSGEGDIVFSISADIQLKGDVSAETNLRKVAYHQDLS
jgi:hypothetical protein